MKRIIPLLIVAMLLVSAFSVFSESFVPDGWSESDIAEFNKHYGNDIGKFFGVTDTSGFTKEQVIDYFNSRPGIIADGYAVDENGIIVEASEVKKDDPPVIDPDDKETAKEVFGFTETEKDNKVEEKPFPVVLAAALAAVLSASLVVLIITKKKSR